MQGLLESGITALTDVVDHAMTAAHVNSVVHSLVIDGIFSGVGGVLSFLPIIVTLFFFLSLLEDSGYMARVALSWINFSENWDSPDEALFRCWSDSDVQFLV